MMDRKAVRAVLILFVIAFLPPLAPAGDDVLAKITVGPDGRPAFATPVSISLDGLNLPLDSGLRLVMVSGSERAPVPSQIEPGGAPRLWWILPAPGEGDGTLGYELLGDTAAPGTPAVTIDCDAKRLDVLKGKDRVLRYHHAVVPPPEGTNPLYARSGFINPLWSPAGAELTRMHPRDHVHHLGLWNPFTKTEFEGRKVDFWNLAAGQGTVRFARFLSRTAGPVFGRFCALHEHVDLSAPGGEKVALDEEWDFRVWNLGGKGKGAYLVDVTSTLRCASKSPITLLEYRYGGLGFRAAESFDKGDYLTSEGKTRADGHATRARWCIVHGPTAEGQAGVLFMDHPQNHEHPQPMRIWNGRPEIFFNFCPVQAADWKLEPGTDYVLRYRLHVFDGTMTPGDAERLWQGFGHPPRITLDYQAGADGPRK